MYGYPNFKSLQKLISSLLHFCPSHQLKKKILFKMQISNPDFLIVSKTVFICKAKGLPFSS